MRRRRRRRRRVIVLRTCCRVTAAHDNIQSGTS